MAQVSCLNNVLNLFLFCIHQTLNQVNCAIAYEHKAANKPVANSRSDGGVMKTKLRLKARMTISAKED